MKLPSVTSLEENFLCNGREEFGNLVSRTLKQGNGAFLKVFGKNGRRPYYITVLMDDEKILAVEAEDVSAGRSLTGKPALEVLKNLLEESPVIVDAFPMSDVEIKMSIVENMEVYTSTPKMKLEEICPSFGRMFSTQSQEPVVGQPSPTQEGREVSIKEAPAVKPKKRKMEIMINAPSEVDPYFRGMIRHLKNVVKGFGIDLRAVEVNAREVRYALGAGNAIHATIRILPDGSLPHNVRGELESFIYKEAGEISKETGKRVVISQIKFS